MHTTPHIAGDRVIMHTLPHITVDRVQCILCHILLGAGQSCILYEVMDVKSFAVLHKPCLLTSDW